jgi:lipopolysaccharide export system permease protein
MKKLDWYILNNFLKTFFFSIFLFTIIAIVIDVSEKTEDFVRSKLSFTEIVQQYYFGFIPHIIALLFPLFVFIAVIFFTSKMAGRSEIIAILASGTPYNRWLRAYWVGGIFLALILWFANQYIIPKANAIKTSFEAKYIDANSSYEALVNSRKGRDIYFKLDSFSYAGIMGYDTASKFGGPFFYNTVQQNKVQKNIRAESIRWDTAKKKWILNYVNIRYIHGIKENVEQQNELEQNFNFLPIDLKKDNYVKTKLTTKELNRFIQLEELRGSETLNDLKVERYRRDAGPFAVILLTLIGAVVAGRKVRGGSGVHLAVGFMTAAIYIIADKFSTVFSTKGNFPPLIAAWLPNVIFCFVAWYLYKKAPK